MKLQLLVLYNSFLYAQDSEIRVYVSLNKLLRSMVSQIMLSSLVGCCSG